jgi:hypothetical protein
MRAKVVRIDSGTRYTDGKRRITLQIEEADSFNSLITLNEDVLIQNGIRTSHLDQQFVLTIRAEV